MLGSVPLLLLFSKAAGEPPMPPESIASVSPSAFNGTTGDVWINTSDSTISLTGSEINSVSNLYTNAVATMGRTSTQRPTLDTVNTLNGFDVMVFDGVNDNLLANAAQVANRTDFTHIIVAKQNAAPSTGVSQHLTGVTSGSCGIRLRENSGFQYMEALAGNSTNGTGALTAQFNAQYQTGHGYVVYAFRSSTTRGFTEVYENGVLMERVARTTGSVTTPTYQIGATGGTSAPFNGAVAEVILLSEDASDANFFGLIRNMREKYALWSYDFATNQLEAAAQRYAKVRNITKSALTPVNFGVISGQSNGTGRGAISSLPSGLQGAISNAFIWPATSFGGSTADPSAWVGLTIGTNNGAIDTSSHGLEPTFADRMLARFDEDIYIFKYCQDGTSLNVSWAPATTLRVQLFVRLRKSITMLGLSGKYIERMAFAWYQGEGDSTGTNPSAISLAYEGNLNALIDEIEAAYPTIQFIDLQLGNNTGSYPSIPTVRQAKIDVSTDRGTVLIAESATFIDGTHADSAGLQTQGIAVANAIV